MTGNGRWYDMPCVVPAALGWSFRCLCEGPSSPSASFEQDLQVLEAAVEVATAIAGNHPHAVTYLKAQFDRFSGLGDRVAAENDALHALAEAGGDFTALNAPNPKTTSGWSAVAWKHR